MKNSLKALFILPVVILTVFAADLFRLNLERLMKAYAYIAQFSYEKPKANLFYAAVEGMTAGLDPHSRFLDPATLRTLREDQSGKFYGLGISITSINGKITIMQVLKGTPAEKAGLLVGDAIVKVDGKSIIGYTSTEAVKVLRGPKGTKVKIEVEREGYKKPLEFIIERAEIPLNSVRYAFMWNSEIGYIALNSFAIKSDEEIHSALKKLKEQGMKYLILDLRGNGGGALNAAVEICDEFLLPPQVIVSTRGRTPESYMVYKAKKSGQYEDLPLAILVNQYSASASEITAGAIQDHRRGLIVGTRTFGKGLVQTLYPLSEDTALALTTAKYYTPSGKCIQKPFTNWITYFWGIYSADYDKTPGGITPDVKIKPQLLKELAARMRGKGLFFRWANLFVNDKRPVSREFLPIIKMEKPGHFKIDKKLLADFLKFAKENGVKYTQKELKEALSDIEFELKYEITNLLWGLEAGTKVLLDNDKTFLKAVELKAKAEEMVDEYLRSTEK